MNIKRLIAGITASAAAAALMTVNAFAAQNTAALADGTAYLNINNDQWSEFDAKWKNTIVTGDGTYTVSMTAEEEQSLALFNALEIVNGEVLFGRTYTVTIDSVKINGAEKKIADGYTCSADGAAVTTRVNIYNEWNNPENKTSDDGAVDCRSADGDFMSKSAKLISDSDLLGVKSIEVKFTVKGVESNSGGNENEDANDDDDSVSGAPVDSGDVPLDSDTASADAEEAAVPDENSDPGEAVVSDENSDPGEAPASDEVTISAKTGNFPAAAMLSLLAISGAAAACSRKRK